MTLKTRIMPAENLASTIYNITVFFFSILLSLIINNYKTLIIINIKYLMS